MKIKNKITLIFILIIALLQGTIFVFIHYFAKSYTEKEFYLRLSQRATIAAQAYLEADEINIDIYDDIRTQHLQILPNEKEVIYQVDVKKREIKTDLTSELPPYFFQEIFENEYAEIKTENFYYTGLLYHDNEGDFIVILSAEDLYGIAKQENLRNILIIAFFLSLVIISILGQYYAKQALLPITSMVKKVNSITATNLHLRLDSGKNKDELDKLALTFNNMLDRLQTSFDLQSNFINNASHELRNPLTAILGQTEISIKKERTQQEYILILKNIEKEALRLDTLVNGLLKLAQTGYDNKGLIIEPIRLDQIIIDIKKNIDQTNPENNIELEFGNLPEDEKLLITHGSYSLLSVSLSNILDNACKFSKNKKVVLKLLADTNFVKVIVVDQGIGIPPDELKNIYEPFYRGSNARGVVGFGFGLPLAYRIIKLHGGNILVSSQINKGTIVKLSLPNQNQYSPITF